MVNVRTKIKVKENKCITKNYVSGFPKAHKMCDSAIIFSQNRTNKSHDRTIFPSFGRTHTFWPFLRSWWEFFTYYYFFWFISRNKLYFAFVFFFFCVSLLFIISLFVFLVSSLVLSFAFHFRSPPMAYPRRNKFVNIKINLFETEVR